MSNLITSTYKAWQSAKKRASDRCRAIMPEMAERLDRCTMFTGTETLPELINLMFSPQGREFILANQFPNLETLRQYKALNPESLGVYIDCGKIALTDPGKVFLIGDTTAEIFCSQTANNTVILMHGATASIYASGYSVTRVEKDRDSSFTATKSNRAVIL